jgi:hypothetical protein
MHSPVIGNLPRCEQSRGRNHPISRVPNNALHFILFSHPLSLYSHSRNLLLYELIVVYYKMPSRVVDTTATCTLTTRVDLRYISVTIVLTGRNAFAMYYVCTYCSTMVRYYMYCP